MTVPVILRIGVLVVATTAFYTYVGQMVPQKEVQPPQQTVLTDDMTTADMVKVGQTIMAGKGICLTCHTIGASGALRFPDLGGIGERAKTRVAGKSDVEYLAESMYDPLAFVAPGFPPAMPPVNQPPIGLTDQEILCVIAALQTLGGTPTVTMKTTHHYYNGTSAPTAPGAAPGAAPPATAAPTAPATAPAPKTGAQPSLSRLQPLVAHRTTTPRQGMVVR